MTKKIDKGSLARIAILSLAIGLAAFMAQGAIAFKPKPLPLVKPELKMVSSISLADVIQLMRNPLNSLADARDGKFYEYVHISGATSMPLEDLRSGRVSDELLKKFKASPNVIVYSVNASDAVAAARLLMEKGVPNAMAYSGGWPEWKACGLPAEGISISGASAGKGGKQ